jgi:hypothetical protein
VNERRELILYATPTGAFGASCDTYFARVRNEFGATTAQTFPPHVTLTGFFRRLPARADEVIAEMSAQIADAGPVPAGTVEVAEMMADAEWVGLRISSVWLTDLSASLIVRHDLTPDDDALRPQDWLHLSLAYGEKGSQPSFAAHGSLAKKVVDPASVAGWEVAVWERRSERADPSVIRWIRHDEQ